MLLSSLSLITYYSGSLQLTDPYNLCRSMAQLQQGTHGCGARTELVGARQAAGRHGARIELEGARQAGGGHGARC